MKTALRFSRTITIAGFAGDPDPNVSVDPLHVWEMGHDAPGRLDASGHALVGAFSVDAPTGTLTFRSWWRDDKSGEWFILAEDTMTHRKRKVTSDLVAGELFVQCLVFANPAGTTFTLRAGEV